MKKLQALTLAAAALALALALDARLASGGAEQEPAPQFVHLKLDAREYSLGRSDAPLTMLEFTDYQCPFCRRFQAETWPLLKKNYIDTGKLRFIVRDLPLQFHSAARPAAEAAHCAGAQGQFWPMHEALLARDMKLDDASLLRQAQAMGLDVARFRECVAGDKYEAAIARNAAQAASLGVHGTPTFILGKVAHGELEGVRIAGTMPYQDLSSYLDQVLAGR
jgi:protein-disulfide isomerase